MKTVAELLSELLTQPAETEWIEWKHNNSDPEEIGEYLSALANAAAQHRQEFGYLVWGIEDGTRRVVGTTFRPRAAKIGNEDLEPWLARMLSPRIDFRIQEDATLWGRVVVFVVPATRHTPVRWRETEFIRVGSYKKKLRDFPEKERALWSLLTPEVFEHAPARTAVSGDEVLALLDYSKYFAMSDQPLPPDRAAILGRLAEERLIASRGGDAFDVTNLGAILFAHDLDAFEALSRKVVRVIRYRGANRVETERELLFAKGYAAGFEELIALINGLLPRNEVIGQALRREVQMYPEKAIRELVPNAMIHQDFSLTGTGPMVELFDDRLEVSNPGLPLIETLRFIDHSPRSRNETLAALMRRLHVCEERGSGIDKVVSWIEAFQLPAPDFRTDGTHTRVVLFAHRALSRMDREDKMRACYQHACLQFVSGRAMNNESLRKRFSIADRNYSIASRIIADALKARLVVLQDPTSKSRKHARYLPFWARGVM